MEIINLIVCAFLSIAVGSIIFSSMRYGISPMPSSKKCINHILNNIPPSCKGRIYELGSGWGGLALKIAAKHPQAEVLAYEVSYVPYIISKIRKALFLKTKNLTITHKDFFTVSLNDADCVVFYLYSKQMKRVQDKICEECPKGTTVISSVFALPHQLPDKIIQLNDLFHSRIYIYHR